MKYNAVFLHLTFKRNNYY